MKCNSNKTNYKEVCTGRTNHAEVVKIEFNNNKISYENILNYFFEIHDPTTLNRQGPDFGTQYRSEIFFENDYQKEIAQKVLKIYNEKYNSFQKYNISHFNHC